MIILKAVFENNEESSRIDFNTIDQLCEFLDVQVGDLFVYKPNTKDDDEEC
ncbi:helix-turn-helix transcriptional regulator [uncultured Psychrobacter sp.]|uniref:helix-turn-helix domain-containing protein n=1 Tax=uncultured Psychrobacter sp. TaxID=259303 RepID=UPI00262AC6BC|nr:helix-turn-helix transcriptional regulator [uncultured Psychrobacter sp.]